MEGKYRHLKEIVSGMESVLVAYSGGIDSSLVLKVAHEVLGNRAAGVTAVSPAYAPAELEAAVSVAHAIGASHFVIHTNQLSNPAFVQNDGSRCYHCKSELYDQLKAFAIKEGYSTIANGTNMDDLKDHRPGLQAAEEKGIRSPLVEARLNKHQVRAMSRFLSLPNWNKPADACLSSRIAYGNPVTIESLGKIDRAEDLLKKEGFQTVRVRLHLNLIRIEVHPDEIPKFFDHALRGRILERLKNLGFSHITIDLEGYRQGSMNAGL